MRATKYVPHVFILVVLTIVGTLLCRAADSPVIVSYLVQSSSLTLHEPVIWRFQARNISSEPIQLDLGKNRDENFIVRFTGPRGGQIQTVKLRKGGFGISGEVSVGPGETYEQDILLNQWINFDEVGKYEIQILLVQSTPEASVLEPQPFRATIEILPLDLQRLRDTCNRLAEQVENATSYQDAADGVLALSFVRNPIAVPFLKSALFAKKGVEVIAINGLEEVGTQEAASALMVALTASPHDVGQIARAALERIEQRTSDPQLKRTIKESLDNPPGPG